MIFSNCPKLFVTNKSVALTSFLNVNPNLVDGSFFLTFAEQNKTPTPERTKDGKYFSFTASC